jgi:hypothetical protein
MLNCREHATSRLTNELAIHYAARRYEFTDKIMHSKGQAF